MNIAKVSCDCCGKTADVAPDSASGFPDSWLAMKLSVPISNGTSGSLAIVNGVHVCDGCRPELARLLVRADDNALELIRTGKAKHS